MEAGKRVTAVPIRDRKTPESMEAGKRVTAVPIRDRKTPLIIGVTLLAIATLALALGLGLGADRGSDEIISSPPPVVEMGCESPPRTARPACCGPLALG